MEIWESAYVLKSENHSGLVRRCLLKNKIKIGVVTGTRAEMGILNPLLDKINKSSMFQLQLYVASMHLSKHYGNTVNEIAHKITDKIDIGIKKSNTKRDMATSLGVGILKFYDSFTKHKPELVVVFGDRIEQYSAAMGAMFLGIPIAHIHGGDVSGGFDDYLRDMITRTASLHFAATETSAKRLYSMIQKKRNIYVVGALGLDSVVATTIVAKSTLARKYGLDKKKDWVLVIYHADTILDERDAREEIKWILVSLEARRYDFQKIVVYPNADAGGGAIIEEIERYNGREDWAIFKNIEHNDFISIMANSKFMVGNSSSALIEAPTLGVPAINVGFRQLGRERAKNVIDTYKVNDGVNDIKSGIFKIMISHKFRNQVMKKESPYYKRGGASKRIITILEKRVREG